MADDDEIDILGDFSFNSCFAQNNQGIPSCSNREDTVHPQWLLDCTETNWYDKAKEIKVNKYNGPSRKLIGDGSYNINDNEYNKVWSAVERQMLVREMAKYGRNVKKLSQVIKTKTETEIQALIDAEYGVHLETSSYGIEKCEDLEDTPAAIQEEIVTDTVTKKVVIIQPPVKLPKHPFRKKNYNSKSLLKSNMKPELVTEMDSEIFYDDDMIIGSTELIGSDCDMTDNVSKNVAKHQAKVKAEKKIGNHRRKVSRNYDKKPRNRSRDVLKSPPGRQRKDSSLSDDSAKSPLLQIVLGSGQALPVSEGEQVIKIEKKKDSEPESDIEIDIDSDNDSKPSEPTSKKSNIKPEEPIAVPLRKFEPMPKRQKKINLDGGGGYTIMHTAAGDLYEVGSEPRRERQPRKQPIHLIRCRVYNAEKPAPFEVSLHVSALVLMDAHAHTSRGEVMGLVGGGDGHGDGGASPRVVLAAYVPAAAQASRTHCDMDPVSQAGCCAALGLRGLVAAAWHHSHVCGGAAPSRQDLRTQAALQRAAPLVAVITAQHWPPGRTASQYCCFRVEEDEGSPEPVGYQFSVKLHPDLDSGTLPGFLQELRTTLTDVPRNEYTVDMVKDICPQANMTYLDKCISSVSHHMRSAGYSDDDPITVQLQQGLRDVFR